MAYTITITETPASGQEAEEYMHVSKDEDMMLALERLVRRQMSYTEAKGGLGFDYVITGPFNARKGHLTSY